MGWHGHLHLHYTRDGERTVALDRHTGPLRVLQRLYPEGPGICHHVLVHPPGGVVGGDTLTVDAQLDAGTHALVTTPGATRFYRSDGVLALQQARLTLAAGARLEWLPLEAIAHPGCAAENRVTMTLAPGAEMIGWDLLALGLPASRDPFDRGSFLQQLELTGQWLDRGRISGSDTRLLDSPLGWAGRRVLGTIWFAAGQGLDPARRASLLDAARECVDADAAQRPWCGATSPAASVIVLRGLGIHVESLMALLAAVRAAWRLAAWQLPAAPPRIWRTRRWAESQFPPILPGSIITVPLKLRHWSRSIMPGLILGLPFIIVECWRSQTNPMWSWNSWRDTMPSLLVSAAFIIASRQAIASGLCAWAVLASSISAPVAAAVFSQFLVQCMSILRG